MATMMEHTEVNSKPAPRKYRDAKIPSLKTTITVPAAAHGETATAETRMRAAVPTSVDLARSSTDFDANAALMKLRELVVGPTQQLNEARLEELIKIFDEREAELRGVMRDIQKRNSELEVTLKQSSLDQLNACKAEFQALTDSMTIESKKVFANIREELAGLRKETLSLVQDAKDVADQKLDAQQLRTKSQIDGETSKLRLDIETVTETLETAMTTGQREAQFNISRVLKEASENLARVAQAS
jgi:F0F1-type ATP synthase membrane subunit b/b'